MIIIDEFCSKNYLYYINNETEHKQGLIDNNRNIIIPAIYDDVVVISNNCFIVRNDEEIYLINSNNERIDDKLYDQILTRYSYNLNLCLVKKGNDLIILDDNGNEIFKGEYNNHFEPIGYFAGHAYPIKTDLIALSNHENKFALFNIVNLNFITEFDIDEINFEEYDSDNDDIDNSIIITKNENQFIIPKDNFNSKEIFEYLAR